MAREEEMAQIIEFVKIVEQEQNLERLQRWLNNPEREPNMILLSKILYKAKYGSDYLRYS